MRIFEITNEKYTGPLSDKQKELLKKGYKLDKDGVPYWDPDGDKVSPFYQDGEEKENVFDIATQADVDKMNPGEKLRYNKTLNRLNKAKEKLEDSDWLDNATPNTIKAQQDVVEKSTKELQSIVDKAGTSFFISLLTPESERLQQRIDVVVGKLENQNLSTNQRKKLESDLEKLETEFDNL